MNQIADCEVLNFGGVVQTKNWVSLSKETQKDDSARPNIHGGSLIAVVEQRFWRHVPFSSDAVFYFHVFLQLHNFLDLLVVL